MPVLEVSDLMHQVGDGVLRGACAHAAALAAQGTPVPVHVNVSAVELGRAGLVARVLSVLDEVGLPPSMLVLEITETQLLDVTGGLVVDLFALRDHGVRIAVDDFGTGYSTLAHLVDLPVDVVKLDGSFVARMTRAADRARVARLPAAPGLPPGPAGSRHATDGRRGRAGTRLMTFG